MSSTLRSMRRSRAKNNMKAMGMKGVCKHDYTEGVNLSGKPGEKTRIDSTFAEKWRELTNGLIIKRRKENEVTN